MVQKKLIVYTHGGGRFANQLICYSHLIGFLIENDYKFDLINLAFWDYSDLLEKTSDNSICTFPTQHNRWEALAAIKKIFMLKRKRSSKELRYASLIQALYTIGYFTPNMQSIIANDATVLSCLARKITSFDLENEEDIKLLNRAKITILGGWKIRSWSLFKKHQAEIRNSLALKAKYTKIAEDFIYSLRKKYDFLIGVLIRQTDYAIFGQGRYFFNTDQYIEWIEQAKNLFSTTAKVGFVIASDEPQNIDKFSNLDVHFATGIAGGKGHYLESMAELSKCDLIMTPPSTFGVWSAFLGDIPIMPLYQKNQILDRQDLLKNHIHEAISHPHLSVSVR